MDLSTSVVMPSSRWREGLRQPSGNITQEVSDKELRVVAGAMLDKNPLTVVIALTKKVLSGPKPAAISSAPSLCVGW